MKIIDITSEVFEWERPGIWNGNHFYGPGKLHKITIYTDENIIGTGWNGGTAAERPLNLMPGYVEYFKPLLINQDPTDTKKIIKDLGTNMIKILGPAGLNTQVLSAINIACWDIKGKMNNISIHKMLGGEQSRIRTYIAGGYYAKGKGIKELQSELLYNINELHATAVKIKIGSQETGITNDIKRVEAARLAIGPDIKLMVDANCALNLEQSLEFAKELINYDVFWFEEPMNIYDYEGHEKLSKSTDIHIATGENGYTKEHFTNLIAHNAASVFNVDVTICGGYDIGQEISELAEKNNIYIAPHGCQELQLPLAAASKNGIFLEYYPTEVDPIRTEMFLPSLRPDSDGFVTLPDRPGIGFELNMDLLNRYKL
ncbi:MAG: mandelate racemase/muconate lactonizing enzyme family protein [SAR202 cluster bacterium]|nr:mandelate racemase/muconate lactonizing enzyme family protein [SAR202 cluster bacterium]|tara:strand:+ start:18744 stop:19859 length:1116 start_codon:yes stop_codon:yes gene_type:complete